MTMFSLVTQGVALAITIAMVSACGRVRPQGPPDVVACGLDLCCDG